MKNCLIILFCFFNVALHAQFVLSADIEKAQEMIMDMRFLEAQALLKSAEKAQPNNGFIPYLRSNIVFIRVFVREDVRNYTSAIDSIKLLIKAVKANKQDTSAYYKFCLAEMNFELGAIHMQFGNNVKSAWVLMDAFKYIKENRGVSKRFLPQQMADGMLNATMGSLPGKYKYLAGLMGYDGDINRGLKQLRSATQTEGTVYDSFRKKFAFVYGYAFSFLGADKNFNIWDVIPAYQDCPLLIYVQARIFRERGENNNLIELLQTRSKKGRQPFYYLDFMLGKAKLNALNPDADASFLTFLIDYPGQNNRKAAHRYLAWHYYLRGNNKQSDLHKRLVQTEGQATSGADKLALIDIEKPFNDALLKAQLYFDGGYLRKAQKVLVAGAPTYTLEIQRIEFHYRMGRIYQQLEEPAQAITSFKNVFTYDASANTFEGANAALQTALLYEQLGNLDEAKKYFQLVLSYSGFPFEDGTHQKAKAGLERLG